MVFTPAPEAAPIPAPAAEPTQAPAVVRTQGQEVGLIRGQVAVYTRARAAAPTQDQVAVRTLGRAVVLRPLRVVGATAGLVVAGRINGIGLILIAKQLDRIDIELTWQSYLAKGRGYLDCLLLANLRTQTLKRQN